MTRFGTRVDPLEVWQLLDRSIATSPNQTVQITKPMYDAIREQSGDNIADHQYKNRMIDALKRNNQDLVNIVYLAPVKSNDRNYKNTTNAETDSEYLHEQTHRLRNEVRQIVRKGDFTDLENLTRLADILTAIASMVHHKELVNLVAEIDDGK